VIQQGCFRISLASYPVVTKLNWVTQHYILSLDRELQHDHERNNPVGARPQPVIPARREEVVNFDPVAVHAPFLLRCAALFIDYIVLMAVPVLGLIIGQLMGAKPGPPGAMAWLFTTLVGLSNFIFLPLLTSQTVGKMLTGLRVTATDGTPVSVLAILLRNVVGYLVTAITLGIGFLIAGITPSGRALHDYLSGTVVIYAKQRRL
jgi:uncharacterized RDD family membrane protein YckC